MKSVKDIDKDIQTVVDSSVWASNGRELNRIKKDLVRLRLIRGYVEQNPSETSIYSQARLVEKRIEDCELEIEAYRDKWDNPEKLIAEAKKKWEYKESKDMLSNLEYILN